MAKETIIRPFNRLTDSHDLNTVFNEQRDQSVIMISGQNELNCPDNFKGNLHIILSYKYNASYAIQFGFTIGAIASRALGPTGWKDWMYL